MTQAEFDVRKLLREVHLRLEEGREKLTAGARIDTDEAPDFARDLRDVLTALHAVMRTVDLESIPSTSSAQSLVAISQHLDASAELARRASESTEGGWRYPKDYSSFRRR